MGDEEEDAAGDGVGGEMGSGDDVVSPALAALNGSGGAPVAVFADPRGARSGQRPLLDAAAAAAAAAAGGDTPDPIHNHNHNHNHNHQHPPNGQDGGPPLPNPISRLHLPSPGAREPPGGGVPAGVVAAGGGGGGGAAPAAAKKSGAPVLDEGTLVKNRWTIVAKIGAGAFGETYVGETVSQPPQTVALKVSIR
ncbi:hypothetical protein DIPPA_14245 [Diplonema papillatum]|nr:hypothetical protein DIPPA_14245 [Diplonema papillatum]